MQPYSRHAEWFDQLLGRTRDHALVFLDAGGTIIDWLGAAERLFGHAAAAAIGSPFGMLFTPEDRQLGMDRQEMAVADAVGRSEDDRWHVRSDGNRFWASGVLEPVRAADGSTVGYLKVLRDRTDVRMRVESLEHRLSTLADQRVRHARFLTSLGHELRGPLNGTRYAVEAALRAEGDPALLNKAHTLAASQIALMARLLDDLVDAARAGVGQMRIAPQRLVLQDALQTAVASVEPASAAKGQQLRLIVPDEPLTLEADPARLQQMLLNLLQNAVRYTGQAGHIAVAAGIEAGEVVVRVDDDGIGIASDMLPRIFELFTRDADAARSAGEGLGVGLALTRELAALHGGSVEARSPGPGRGSQFVLRLPQRRAYGSQTAAAAPPPS